MANIRNFQECFKTPICDAYRATKKICGICQEIIDRRIAIGKEKQSRELENKDENDNR